MGGIGRSCALRRGGGTSDLGGTGGDCMVEDDDQCIRAVEGHDSSFLSFESTTMTTATAPIVVDVAEANFLAAVEGATTGRPGNVPLDYIPPDDHDRLFATMLLQDRNRLLPPLSRKRQSQDDNRQEIENEDGSAVEWDEFSDTGDQQPYFDQQPWAEFGSSPPSWSRKSGQMDLHRHQVPASWKALWLKTPGGQQAPISATAAIQFGEGRQQQSILLARLTASTWMHRECASLLATFWFVVLVTLACYYCSLLQDHPDRCAESLSTTRRGSSASSSSRGSVSTGSSGRRLLGFTLNLPQLCAWPYILLAPSHHDAVSLDTTTTRESVSSSPSSSSSSSIVMIVLQNDPDWKVLTHACQQYQSQTQQILSTLSQALESAIPLEHDARVASRQHQAHSTKHNPSQVWFTMWQKQNMGPLTKHLKDRIARLAHIYEHDAGVLRQIVLVPFAYVKVLPFQTNSRASGESLESNSCDSESKGLDATKEIQAATFTCGHAENCLAPIRYRKQSLARATLILPLSTVPDAATNYVTRKDPPSYRSSSFDLADANLDEDASKFGPATYDSADQIVAHLVRDWSTAGRTIRTSLYDWCIDQIKTYSSSRPRGMSSSPLSIAVPGAGVGRLAWELAVQLPNSTVEAMEISLTMAAAAASILQSTTIATPAASAGNILLHPYSIDFFTNEVHSEDRYESIVMPDVHDRLRPLAQSNSRLVYTVTDFLAAAHLSVLYHDFRDVVVTCFFIDTATNIFDYIAAIHNILQPQTGLWVNVGPLQWHRNNLLTGGILTANVLREMLDSTEQFEVLHWSVDETPTEYRSSNVEEVNDQGNQRVRSTLLQAYHPLRFILRKV